MIYSFFLIVKIGKLFNCKTFSVVLFSSQNKDTDLLSKGRSFHIISIISWKSRFNNSTCHLPLVVEEQDRTLDCCKQF